MVQYFGLQTVLNRMGDESTNNPVTMQCSDNAALLTILAASQGTTVPPLYFKDKNNPVLAQSALYKPAGSQAPGCNQVPFNFHQVPALGSFTASQIQVVGLEALTFVGLVPDSPWSVYTLKVRIKNDGESVSDLQGTFATLDPTLFNKLPDNSLDFGSVAGGATVLSNDTLTLWWDTTKPFDAAKLVADFSRGDPQGAIYDTSIQKAVGTLSSCTAAGYYLGVLFPDYLTQALPGPPAQTDANTHKAPVTILVGNCPCVIP
jgi:hypothetical protein